MKDIKLVAIDLDETLLTTDKKIPEKNFKAVEKARELGIHIVFASGRHFDGVKTITSIIGNTDYCISSVGSVITDRNDKLVYTNCIDEKMVYNFLQFMQAKKIYTQVYPPLQHFLFENRCPYTDKYEQTSKCIGQHCPNMYSRKDIRSTKLLMIDEPDVLLSLQKELSEQFPGYSYLLSQPDHLEIIKSNASKGDTLKHICNMLNISTEQTLAIGDSEVDLEMFNCAGHSACPANAIEAIKKRSEYISIKTNNENAVADILNYYIFGEEK